MMKYLNIQAASAVSLAGTGAMLMWNFLSEGSLVNYLAFGSLFICHVAIFAQAGALLTQVVSERDDWLRTFLDTQKLWPLLRRQSEALEDVRALIAETEGVTGLHTKGDVVPWFDLLAGGKDEVWLGNYSEWLEKDVEYADSDTQDS